MSPSLITVSSTTTSSIAIEQPHTTHLTLIQPNISHNVIDDHDDAPFNILLLLDSDITQEATTRLLKSPHFQVVRHKGVLSENELLAKITSYHAIICIDTKTKITARVIKSATQMCVYTSTPTEHPITYLFCGVLYSSWLSVV
jgi:hypothetical protein